MRYKLPLMFIGVCLLAFGVGAYLVSGSAREALEVEILARLEFQSRAHATALEGCLQTLTRRTEDFASDGFIREYTEELLGSSADADTSQLKGDLLSHPVENKLPLEAAFIELYLVDASGTVLVSTNEQCVAVLPEAISTAALDAPSRISDFLPCQAGQQERDRSGGGGLGLLLLVHPAQPV
ncbi:MAG: hypothetical protein ABGY71_13835 [bacterium]|nr:hypothetical protein [Planctomycetota bacterium]HIL50937.1 hypothetical protein [Planctomycetota bacterium]